MSHLRHDRWRDFGKNDAKGVGVGRKQYGGVGGVVGGKAMKASRAVKGPGRDVDRGQQNFQKNFGKIGNKKMDIFRPKASLGSAYNRTCIQDVLKNHKRSAHTDKSDSDQVSESKGTNKVGTNASRGSFNSKNAQDENFGKANRRSVRTELRAEKSPKEQKLNVFFELKTPKTIKKSTKLRKNLNKKYPLQKNQYKPRRIMASCDQPSSPKEIDHLPQNRSLERKNRNNPYRLTSRERLHRGGGGQHKGFAGVPRAPPRPTKQKKSKRSTKTQKSSQKRIIRENQLGRDTQASPSQNSGGVVLASPRNRMRTFEELMGTKKVRLQKYSSDKELRTSNGKNQRSKGGKGGFRNGSHQNFGAQSSNTDNNKNTQSGAKFSRLASIDDISAQVAHPNNITSTQRACSGKVKKRELMSFMDEYGADSGMPLSAKSRPLQLVSSESAQLGRQTPDFNNMIDGSEVKKVSLFVRRNPVMTKISHFSQERKQNFAKNGQKVEKRIRVLDKDNCSVEDEEITLRLHPRDRANLTTSTGNHTTEDSNLELSQEIMRNFEKALNSYQTGVIIPQIQRRVEMEAQKTTRTAEFVSTSAEKVRVDIKNSDININLQGVGGRKKHKSESQETKAAKNERKKLQKNEKSGKRAKNFRKDSKKIQQDMRSEGVQNVFGTPKLAPSSPYLKKLGQEKSPRINMAGRSYAKKPPKFNQPARGRPKAGAPQAARTKNHGSSVPGFYQSHTDRPHYQTAEKVRKASRKHKLSEHHPNRIKEEEIEESPPDNAIGSQVMVRNSRRRLVEPPARGQSPESGVRRSAKHDTTSKKKIYYKTPEKVLDKYQSRLSPQIDKPTPNGKNKRLFNFGEGSNVAESQGAKNNHTKGNKFKKWSSLANIIKKQNSASIEKNVYKNEKDGKNDTKNSKNSGNGSSGDQSGGSGPSMRKTDSREERASKQTKSKLRRKKGILRSFDGTHSPNSSQNLFELSSSQDETKAKQLFFKKREGIAQIKTQLLEPNQINLAAKPISGGSPKNFKKRPDRISGSFKRIKNSVTVSLAKSDEKFKPPISPSESSSQNLRFSTDLNLKQQSKRKNYQSVKQLLNKPSAKKLTEILSQNHSHTSHVGASTGNISTKRKKLTAKPPDPDAPNKKISNFTVSDSSSQLKSSRKSSRHESGKAVSTPKNRLEAYDGSYRSEKVMRQLIQTSNFFRAKNYYIKDLKSHYEFDDPDSYFCGLFKDHFWESFKALKVIQSMNQKDDGGQKEGAGGGDGAQNDDSTHGGESQGKKRKLSKDEKLILVLDLDETLIHCYTKPTNTYQHLVRIKQPEGFIISAKVNVRPFTTKFLESLAKIYEIVLFTASKKHYADCILNLIDPNDSFFSRKFYRDDCVMTTNGYYVKDLTKISKDLSKVILVDNSCSSFSQQLNNGIPIIPYFFKDDDIELIKLRNFLLNLSNLMNKVDDVRLLLKNYFKFEEWLKYDSCEQAFQKIFCERRETKS